MSKKQLALDLIEYIDSNINEEIRVSDLPKIFYYDRFYIARAFKEETGMTLPQYINKKRVVNSMDSLINTDYRILKIAMMNGFNSQEYYTEVFNRVTGFSPLDFKKFVENYNLLISGDEKIVEFSELVGIREKMNEIKMLEADVKRISMLPFGDKVNSKTDNKVKVLTLFKNAS